MSNQIIGNIEYSSIKEKAYINGTQENIMRLAAKLDKAGISYSGRISDYRSAITVEAADRARTLEILKGVLNTAKENIPEDNSEKNIIGNAEYRYISNKRYVRGETEAMLRTADRLTAENISFSGRVKGDTVTLTVSGDETQELVKRYFAEEKNRIENVQSAYFLALSSDTFEDGYYISEVNATTGEEISPYRSSFGDISMFVSVDSAVQYAEGAGITLSNTAEQLNEWCRIETKAEAERERQLNLSRSREMIKRLPMTEQGYEEHFMLREDVIDWIYFNPDGADGEGQFVQTSLYADDFIAAYNARSNADDSQSAFIEAIQNGKQTIINADTEEFERLADTFIKSRSNENVIVSAPVVSGNRYSNSFERIINLLENHFEDVRKYKENHITEASKNISVEGHIGTWYVIAAEEIEGKKLFLLEHEKYGDEAANIIIDENKNLVMEDVYNGFDDYRDSLEYDDGKQFVSRDFAVELWQNGFTILMNERSNELTSRKNDPKGFDLFLDENNNNFYAFNKDIVQQRLLDDTVTLLDGLNDAAIIEAGENNKSIDTAENYAKDMFDDGGCAYRWNDGITEWQNISASILSGNTEYLYAWLNDLPLELPYLEENRDVSITNALKYLDNYEKEYMGKLSIDELKKGTRLVYNNTNWEVTHVNNNVLALKNLDSNNEMSSTIIERWQNVVTRNKVKFIEEKENSPLENNSQEAAENNSNKTLIINAFGGPGAGKSTACLHITSELKKRGFVAEYVSEYAKELVWDKNFEMLDGSERHQKMILEEQKKRMDRLIGQVDFVVSDAPILLNSVYLNSDDKHSYDEALVNLFNQYDNFNLEVIRDVNNFEEEGRIHNLEQSQQADNDIRTLLNRNNIYFGTYSHGNLDKIVDNAVVTYNKLSSKTIVIPEIPSRLSVISPVGKYIPDESLPLSEQLLELAERELADYENSLDTAEKAKAAAYELSVKRDILSYIEYDLAEDITDPDVETACRQLISTGYPLDTFYQDWLKNEYDNRMEAIRMTAADTFRKEIPQNDYKLEADTKDYVIDGQEGTWSVVNSTEIDGRQLFELESDNYGYTPEVGHIIADVDGNVLAENVHSGFGNFYFEKARETAHNAGLPFRETVAEDKKDLAVQNAFQKLKDNHDFSPEVVKLLERVEKLIIGNDWENFNSKIFEVPLFQQTYGSVSRVNEKLFGGELRSIIDEVNGYIFEEQLPNKELFSESDLSTLREIKAEHDRSNAEEAEKERTLEKAKKLINDFCDREYSSTGDFSDLHNVSIAYTTLTDDELPIQVTADLVDFKITFELNGEKYNEEKYNSLEDLIDYELSNLDFDELVYVPDRVLEKYMSGGKSNELMNDFSEAVEKALKTVTNQYNSFLLVQDVVYSLRDLQDGYADDYDWKNYAEAFKNVLDSNVHTEIALPLYKSEAYEILLAAAERKEISADDIAKALKNLELVLQNSQLLKNPEAKSEQMSFFDSSPNISSSDEIGYVSKVPQSEKEKSPMGNNSQEEFSENENDADYTITDKNYGTEGGAKTRFANNVDAIKLLKTLEKENRTATPEEQEVLAKYVGWGGIANAFDSRKPDWSKEYSELKGLLTDEEYRAARASTMNAHYTSPTVINAIYSALDNMGFDGGKILEPSMGIGNFFGAMPENIRANSDLHGVELDSVTGRIAKQLYPNANIQIKGYEDTNFENGSFDVAVGNVPFGSYKLNDKDYNKQNFFIHDYFFAKTLDKVRPGGIVAFVTSKGTLDKESPEVRKYLAERAEFLGAIRLPNNAFKANAGTEVTSDIIFLQKRERPISIEEDTPEWVYKDMLPNGIAVNKYFADHPDMILGEMVEGNKLYGNQTDASMCIPIEGADLEKQLAEAVKNITGEYKAAKKEIEKSPVGNTDEIPCPPGAPKYSFIVQDDILYYHKASDTMEKYNAPETSVEKIKAMVQLRDSVHSLLDLQLNNTDGRFDTAISEAQAALNKQYDNFSENYGLISNAENKMLFRNDNSYHLIKSLEKLDKDGNFIGKADIFSKITVNPNVVVDHCDNAQDALILSLSEKMCVNLEYMSILTGKSEEEIVSELDDKIFQNPQKYMRWESADEYLTGNIRSKLAAAEAAGLTRNAEALRAVMPERIEAADIAVKLGAAWIDPDYIRQFIIETLKPDYITSKNIEVTYMPATDKWKIEGWRSAYNNVLATETYGTFDMNAYEIIEATLNMQKAEIRQRVKDERGNDLRDSKGRYVYEVNQQKTMIVQAKQDELKRKFSDWIFSDPDRREKLVDVYNEKFNSVRLREYDGSHLNFVGMSSAITLKEHQKNAVARGLYSNGNTLLAHEVGAGKTFEMIAIAMEGKRLGLHNKSLITAPNGLTEQWGNAFRTLYPNANVLVATEKDFQKENRRDLFAKIATGDWDAVIIGHSQFDMIHLSRERELDVLHTELDRLEEALREMDDGAGRKSFSVKQIEKAIKTYEDKIEKLLAKSPEDDMLCFEKLGIDKIFVDESQAYKNLDTPTKMRNVSGIGSGGSGRAMQLLMKCKYLDELTGGKGTVFASGTPISNSMSEMYTLMRYLQADKLAELGINSFDRWASVFGETATSMELSPEGNGKYQNKTRFAKFQNLPELMNIFKECADIKTADTLNLDRPDFEMHNVNVPATAVQATMIKELGERAKEIRAGHVDPTDDNMCKLTVDGRKIGLDGRCMNPNLSDDPKSKVNVCINNVFDVWQRTAEEKSTQLIFCDLATPQPTLNENTYTVYRKNTKGGYSDVYSAKLGEKNTAEKIMKKLNGKKPPKNYEAGDVADGDIIMLKRVNYEEETAYNTAFEVVDGKLTEIAPETWEKLKHKPVEQFESERKFCVYDDIKQKLIAKGVPEKEIAFIHDVDKAEDKQKLYDKMNKGEIRVLIGSTSKCGAGMNAQERMIALHDLDAPMRPSDVDPA